jgi:hypothetical protein
MAAIGTIGLIAETGTAGEIGTVAETGTIGASMIARVLQAVDRALKDPAASITAEVLTADREAALTTVATTFTEVEATTMVAGSMAAITATVATSWLQKSPSDLKRLEV